MTQGVPANFAPHFAPSPAFVAQWIEQRFPKPQVVGPIPTEGASNFPHSVFRKLGHAASSRAHAACINRVTWRGLCKLTSRARGGSRVLMFRPDRTCCK